MRFAACVLNFLSYDAAYSMYPRATFEERTSLCFSSLTERDIGCLSKYAVRGWRSLSNFYPHERSAERIFHVNQHRFVGDSKCWVIPLDTTGLELRPALTPVSERFVWDPVQYNSWVLTMQNGKMFLAYHVLKPTLFRYTYLFADMKIIEGMMDFLRQHGKFEHRIHALVPDEDKAAAWSWCVDSNHMNCRVTVLMPCSQVRQRLA